MSYFSLSCNKAADKQTNRRDWKWCLGKEDEGIKTQTPKSGQSRPHSCYRSYFHYWHHTFSANDMKTCKSNNWWRFDDLKIWFAVWTVFHKTNFKRRIREVQEVLWDFRVGCDGRSGVKLLILVARVCRELFVWFLLSLPLHHWLFTITSCDRGNIWQQLSVTNELTWAIFPQKWQILYISTAVISLSSWWFNCFHCLDIKLFVCFQRLGISWLFNRFKSYLSKGNSAAYPYTPSDCFLFFNWEFICFQWAHSTWQCL